MPSYPANEQNYHHWRAIDVERGSVVLNILVHPKNPQKIGTWVFSVEVVKSKSRWLVNRIYTIAVMNPPVRPATVTHELGPADYAAPPADLADVDHDEPLEPLVPAAGGRDLRDRAARSRWRSEPGRSCAARRWRRSVRASGRTELPPLPSSYRGGAEEQKELASQP